MRHLPVSLLVFPHNAKPFPYHSILKNISFSFHILQFSSGFHLSAVSVVLLRLLHASVCLRIHVIAPDTPAAS